VLSKPPTNILVAKTAYAFDIAPQAGATELALRSRLPTAHLLPQFFSFLAASLLGVGIKRTREGLLRRISQSEARNTTSISNGKMMRTTQKLLATTIAFLALAFAASQSNADVVLTSSTAQVIGNAVVARSGSNDSGSFDETLNGTSGFLTLNEMRSVGPVASDGNSPGTSAEGLASASAILDFRTADEINVELFSAASLSSIESDGNSNGTYSASSQSLFNLSFVVDQATDYDLIGDAIIEDDTPSWQIRLQGPTPIVINNFSNPGGGALSSSGILQPGNYTLSGFVTNGLGGSIPETNHSTSLNFSFQAARAVPEPSSAAVVLIAISVVGLRRRKLLG